MNELKIFNNEQFGEIRTIEENNKVLFCGADVAKALGYSNARDAVLRHCRGVVKRDTPTTSGTQEMSFITEGDVYRLITHSKLFSARWCLFPTKSNISRRGIKSCEKRTNHYGAPKQCAEKNCATDGAFAKTFWHSCY